MLRHCFAAALPVAVALGLIAPRARAAEPPEAAQYFLDEGGERVPFRPAYDAWFGTNRYRRDYARAFAENAALMGLELFVYWYDPNSNMVDWQYPDVVSKLTSRESLRFDDNLSRTNWLLHPFAGALHYDFTRANGFGVPGSFAAALLASTSYEMVFEWREVISINDLIVTPLAGMAVGEFAFHLGDYLNSRPIRPRRLDEVVGPGPFARIVAASSLGGVNAFHGAKAPSQGPRLSDDDLGLSSAYAHRFRLLAGLDVVSNDQREAGDVSVVAAQAELVSMPGFLRPGRFSTSFADGNFTSANVRVAFADRVRDLDVLVDSHLFGHYAQDFDEAPGGVNGAARELAVHTALHYVDRWLLERRDHYAMLHILAPIATFWFGRGPLMVRVSGDVSPDFADPRALAYQKWAGAYGTEGTKSSLRAHGYYFAWGGSAGVSSSISLSGLAATASARYGHYESIDGVERELEPVTREVHATDEILELEGSLGFESPETVFTAGLSGAHVARLSRMAPLSVARSDRRLGGYVGIRF